MSGKNINRQTVSAKGDVTIGPVNQVVGRHSPSHERTSGKIFISYRRNDSAGHTGRIHDRLTREFGEGVIFMDVGSVPLGTDFTEVIEAEVNSCDVLLAIIGPNWLNSLDAEKNRRLDDPNDFVRIEILTALKRNIPVIPILMEDTALPAAEALPSELLGLSKRNAMRVRHESFQEDIDKLTKALQSHFASDG